MNNQPKKYVIYTAMVGGYDEIMQPKVVDDRFDYILFSNDIKEDRIGIWQVRPIEYTNPDNTRICRYVKTHPEELLHGYEFSIWMDSNIRIMTSYVYERAFELYDQGTLIASMCHPERDCIYDEAFEVMYIRYEREKVVVDWCHKLRTENYPRHNGLFETGIMFRKKSNIIENFNCLWWNCIDAYSKRDQLSFNYVLWKLSVKCEYFFDKYNDVRSTNDLSYIEHKNIGKKLYPSSPNDSWLLCYSWKKTYKRETVKQYYWRIYASHFPYFWISLLGQYYRVKDIYQRYKSKLFY